MGDIVKLSVTWIGPTRERLVEEASLRYERTLNTMKNVMWKFFNSLKVELLEAIFSGISSATS